MKQSHFFLLAGLAIFIFATESTADWVKTHSPASCITANGSYVFAGTNDGKVSRSTDYGATWTLVNSDSTSSFVTSITASNSRVWYSTNRSGVFYSTDNGTNWRQAANEGLAYYQGYYESIVDLAASGPSLVASGINGIYTSSNDGNNWTLTLRNPGPGRLYAIGSTVFAGIDGALRSDNNGSTWMEFQNGFSELIYRFTYMANRLYAGTDGGVFFSTDNGETWTQAGLTDKRVRSLTATASIVIAGTEGSGAFISHDSGESWAQFNDGLSIPSSGPLFSLPSITVSGDYVLAVYGGDVWRRPLSETQVIDSDSDGVADNQDDFPLDPAETRDTDGDGEGNNADTDDDNDGMPDVWEVLYNLDPLIDDASQDPDGDGVSNLNEYLAETDPDKFEDALEPDAPVLLSSFDDDIVSLTPELKTDAFYDPDPDDIHARTQWRIFRQEDDFCVFDVISSAPLTSLQVPKLILEEDRAYTWQVRFFNNRGAASAWSETGIFVTDIGKNDLDGNGIPDHQEVETTLDLDANGVLDREQSDLKCVTTAKGNFKLGISIRDSEFVDSIAAIESEDPKDMGVDLPTQNRPNYLPLGLIHFKLIVNQPGDEVLVTFYLSEAVYDDGNWYKYNPVNNEWLDYSDYAEFSEDRKIVYLRLKDGGFGDADGIANGIIVDPLALGTETDHRSGSDSSVDDKGDSNSDNNSCFISTAAPRQVGEQVLNLRSGAGGSELSTLIILMLFAYTGMTVYLRFRRNRRF